MAFQLEQISPNIYSILEVDDRKCNPLSYVIIGTEKAMLIDTGCGCGNMYTFVRNIEAVKNKSIIVVNTHNHHEQTGGNWRFSTTGKFGLAKDVEDLCASKKNKYYTKLLDSDWHWEVRTYKITRWLSDGEIVYLGDDRETVNEVKVMWTPGHTPDSLVLWYAHDRRLFVGDLFYRFADIYFTYKYCSLRDYDTSIRKILEFVKAQLDPSQIRYSAAKNDSNNECLPAFKLFHRFLMNILAGTQFGIELRIDEGDGFRFETRDKSMRIVLSKTFVLALNQAREKANNHFR